MIYCYTYTHRGIIHTIHILKIGITNEIDHKHAAFQFAFAKYRRRSKQNRKETQKWIVSIEISDENTRPYWFLSTFALKHIKVQPSTTTNSTIKENRVNNKKRSIKQVQANYKYEFRFSLFLLLDSIRLNFA